MMPYYLSSGIKKCLNTRKTIENFCNSRLKGGNVCLSVGVEGGLLEGVGEGGGG